LKLIAQYGTFKTKFLDDLNGAAFLSSRTVSVAEVIPKDFLIFQNIKNLSLTLYIKLIKLIKNKT